MDHEDFKLYLINDYDYAVKKHNEIGKGDLVGLKDDSVIINCPNEEVWQELSQQPEKIAKLNQKVNRLILKYANYQELVFDQENCDR